MLFFLVTWKNERVWTISSSQSNFYCRGENESVDGKIQGTQRSHKCHTNCHMARVMEKKLWIYVGSYVHYMTSHDKNYVIYCDCSIVGVNEMWRCGKGTKLFFWVKVMLNVEAWEHDGLWVVRSVFRECKKDLLRGGVLKGFDSPRIIPKPSRNYGSMVHIIFHLSSFFLSFFFYFIFCWLLLLMIFDLFNYLKEKRNEKYK